MPRLIDATVAITRSGHETLRVILSVKRAGERIQGRTTSDVGAARAVTMRRQAQHAPE